MSYKINGRTVIKAPEGFPHTINTKKHQGMAYEYIVVASMEIGRYLTADECVHHIDLNPDNNSAGNLMVFASQSDHAKFHSSGLDVSILINRGDGTYSVDPSWRPSEDRFICAHCGKEFIASKANRKNRHTYCSSECYNSYRLHGKIVPSKQRLAELLSTMSNSAVARLCGVTHTTVRRWKKRYNIL